MINEIVNQQLVKSPQEIYNELMSLHKFCDEALLMSLVNKSLENQNSSSEHFIYNGSLYWLDKYTRTSLLSTLDDVSDDFSLILDTTIILIDPRKLTTFLKDLNTYSYKCKLATTQHLNNLNSALSLEEYLNNDITSNYPEKLVLNEYL